MTVASSNTVVVLHAFGPYTRGEILIDPEIISAILNSGHASLVIPTKVLPHYPGNTTTSEER